jgi:hypothetical protein
VVRTEFLVEVSFKGVPECGGHWRSHVIQVWAWRRAWKPVGLNEYIIPFQESWLKEAPARIT